MGGGLRTGRGLVHQARRRPGQCTVREPSKAPSFQNCRHHMEVGRWPGHRAGRLLYPPSEACKARSQVDEGSGEQGRPLVAEEAGCPRPEPRSEAAARRPLQAWLPGLPVHAGLTFCVGQPGPSCAGPRVAAPPWACSAGGLPLHQLRGLEGRGRTGGVHVAEEELGAWDSVSSYEGPWRSGLHAPQQDFGLSLELSI